MSKGAAPPRRRPTAATTIAAVPEALCVGLVAGIPLVLTAAIVGRYTGWFHLRWSDEVARAMIIWLAFLGAGVAVRREAHFRIALLASRTSSERTRKAAESVTHVSLAATGVLMIYLGWRLIEGALGQTTVVLKIPVPLLYASLPLGGLLFIVYSAANLVRTLREGPRPEPGGGAVPQA